jgi:hypothetical protein
VAFAGSRSVAVAGSWSAACATSLGLLLVLLLSVCFLCYFSRSAVSASSLGLFSSYSRLLSFCLSGSVVLLSRSLEITLLLAGSSASSG